MSTRSTDLAERVEAGALQIVGALVAACDEGLSVGELTELLGVALRRRNQIDAAVTRTIGAVDTAGAWTGAGGCSRCPAAAGPSIRLRVQTSPRSAASRSRVRPRGSESCQPPGRRA